MNTIMGQYMDKMSQQLLQTTQAIREETMEENKQLRAQVQKLRGPDKIPDEDVERQAQEGWRKMDNLVEAQLANNKTKSKREQ